MHSSRNSTISNGYRLTTIAETRRNAIRLVFRKIVLKNFRKIVRKGFRVQIVVELGE
jgi:hypothetical protein